MGAPRGPHAAALLNMAGGFLTPGMVVPPEVREAMFNALSSGVSLAGDLIEWKADADRLAVSLVGEAVGLRDDVTGAVWDVYANKKGVLPIAEAWDKRINNMGAAHAKFSRKHQWGPMSFLGLNSAALWFAGDDETKQMLLRHYMWAQGKACDLSFKEMRAMRSFIDFFDTVSRKVVIDGTEKTLTPYSESLKAAVEDAKWGQSRHINAVVSGASNALGNFAVHLKGVMRPATDPPVGPTVSPYKIKDLADPGVPLVFEGRMNFTDLWDFDAKVAGRFTGDKSTGRPATAEMAVDAVAALVDGVPFDVTSDDIPVTQHSGHAPIY